MPCLCRFFFVFFQLTIGPTRLRLPMYVSVLYRQKSIHVLNVCVLAFPSVLLRQATWTPCGSSCRQRTPCPVAWSVPTPSPVRARPASTSVSRAAAVSPRWQVSRSARSGLVWSADLHERQKCEAAWTHCDVQVGTLFSVFSVQPFGPLSVMFYGE